MEGCIQAQRLEPVGLEILGGFTRKTAMQGIIEGVGLIPESHGAGLLGYIYKLFGRRNDHFTVAQSSFELVVEPISRVFFDQHQDLVHVVRDTKKDIN